jgi:hypothetical protein
MTAMMRLAATFIGFALCAAAIPVRAEEPAGDPWQFSIAPYLWVTSLNGDIGLRGRKSQVDASFIDILQNTDSVLGFEGHAEARKGDWGVYLDGVYTRLAAKADPIAALNIRAVSELSIVEAGAFYQIGQWNMGTITDELGGGMSSIALQTYAGARYTTLDLKLQASDGVTQDTNSADKSWVDPLVGVRTIIDLTSRLQLIAGADIGGFGVGSDLTWSAIGLVGYKMPIFGLDTTTVIGYRALYQDYKDGNANAFKWDMTIHGPIMGTIIRF